VVFRFLGDPVKLKVHVRTVIGVFEQDFAGVVSRTPESASPALRKLRCSATARKTFKRKFSNMRNVSRETSKDESARQIKP
jgi:hypothetical protein